jgi:dihydrofolate reductase
MPEVVLSMSMSLDGYVCGPDVSEEHAMGRGGERLHRWIFPEAGADGPRKEDADIVLEAMHRVRAVVIGRRMFDVGYPHWKDTPHPLPTFVVTHERREPRQEKSASFHFVDGVEEAIADARLAAHGKQVLLMGGPDIANQALARGLVDEIHIQVVPVLLGNGGRLFDDAAQPPMELEQVSAVKTQEVVHLHYRVKR